MSIPPFTSSFSPPFTSAHTKSIKSISGCVLNHVSNFIDSTFIGESNSTDVNVFKWLSGFLIELEADHDFNPLSFSSKTPLSTNTKKFKLLATT